MTRRTFCQGGGGGVQFEILKKTGTRIDFYSAITLVASAQARENLSIIPKKSGPPNIGPNLKTSDPPLS